MFSLLLNIYAKWHPEMFNPYLHGSPGAEELEGSVEEDRDWGGKAPSLQFRLWLCGGSLSNTSPGLWLQAQAETHAAIVHTHKPMRSSMRTGHIRGKSRNVWCGVGRRQRDKAEVGSREKDKEKEIMLYILYIMLVKLWRGSKSTKLK